MDLTPQTPMATAGPPLRTLVRPRVEHPRRGIGSGLGVVALGAWALLAPLLFGAHESAAWGWHPLHAALVPAGAAVLGGLGMATARPSAVRVGGLVALAGGLGLMLGALAGPLWAGAGFGALGTLEDGTQLLVWIAFFGLAGGLIATAGAYALGLLDRLPSGWQEITRSRLDHAVSCEARRRRVAQATLARPHRHSRR